MTAVETSEGRPRWSFEISDPDLVEGVMRIIAPRAGLAVETSEVEADDDDLHERAEDGTREFRRARHRLRFSREGKEVAAAVIGERVICTAAREEVSRGSRLEIEAAPTAAEQILKLLEELVSARCIDAAEFAPSSATSTPNVAATPEVAGLPIARFAHESVVERIEEFLFHAPPASDGGDALALLVARDSSRRLRAALGLFEPWLPKWLASTGPRLDPILTSLDAIRTLGVQLERLSAWNEDLDVLESVRQELLTVLRAQFTRARARLRSVFGTPAFSEVETLFRGAGEEFEARGHESRDTVGDVLESLLRGRFRRYRDYGISLTPDSPAGAFHRLLALCETLGFSLERFEGVLGEHGGTYLRALSAVHERLLRHQDADLAAQHLKLIAERTQLASGNAGAFAFGLLAERHRQRGRLALDGFIPSFSRTTGARWGSLSAVLRTLGPPTPDVRREPRGREVRRRRR